LLVRTPRLGIGAFFSYKGFSFVIATYSTTLTFGYVKAFLAWLINVFFLTCLFTDIVFSSGFLLMPFSGLACRWLPVLLVGIVFGQLLRPANRAHNLLKI
jgi:hypothetical protein